MAFTDLPEVYQLIYFENYIFIMKLIIIAFFLIGAILIIKNFKPIESKFKMVKITRSMYYYLSWLIIFTIPFHFAYLSPKINISAVWIPTILFYTLSLTIFGLIIALNTVLHGFDFVKDLLFNDIDKNKDYQYVKKRFIEKVEIPK
ncbi:MAG: hypothetical protein ACOCUD_04195 [Bacillota bacterium]